jgi:RNA polymerase sigma-70 factor (ECF subfamily)
MSMEMEGRGLDEVAVRSFLLTEYPRLVAALTLVTASRAAAEDAAAEAIARAWEASDRGQAIESLPAWVTRVALNVAKSRWRRLRAEARANERAVSAAPDARSPAEDRVDIERALAALTTREREVTVLRYYLEFDTAEAAEALGVSEGTVKTLLSRARAKLAAALGEPQPEEVDDRAGLR